MEREKKKDFSWAATVGSKQGFAKPNGSFSIRRKRRIATWPNQTITHSFALPWIGLACPFSFSCSFPSRSQFEKSINALTQLPIRLALSERKVSMNLLCESPFFYLSTLLF